MRYFLVFFLSLFFFSPVLAGQELSILVLDSNNNSKLPNHFRQSIPNGKKDINWTGLTDLHIAGGGQFSETGLEKIKEKLQDALITIIDLRQESHGFINESAVSWYGLYNADNAKRSPAQIEQRQNELLKELPLQKIITVYKIIEKTSGKQIIETQPIDFFVQETNSEKELAANHHVGYYRFYVQDYHAPKPQEVDRFLKIIKQIRNEHWIYFHCRGGVGRSTTFMVMYDMLHNAKKVSFDDILIRHYAIDGKNLKALPRLNSYKYRAAYNRLQFLKKFYEYAQKNADNFTTSWSSWLSSKENEIY